jgi:hypothetical protein
LNKIYITSSNLVSIDYDLSSQTLQIEFNGGRVYQYFDVPQSQFEGLRNATSHGQYFNEFIKGKYRYARV